MEKNTANMSIVIPSFIDVL